MWIERNSMQYFLLEARVERGLLDRTTFELASHLLSNDEYAYRIARFLVGQFTKTHSLIDQLLDNCDMPSACRKTLTEYV